LSFIFSEFNFSSAVVSKFAQRSTFYINPSPGPNVGIIPKEKMFIKPLIIITNARLWVL
jgi:hypothetical protein